MTSNKDMQNGPKTLTPRSVPVSIFETPPLEINLLRKASSLLRNVSRASVNPVAARLPNLWVESASPLSPVLNLKFGALGELSIPQNPSPTRWKFIYARDDFRLFPTATRMPTRICTLWRCLRESILNPGYYFGASIHNQPGSRELTGSGPVIKCHRPRA